MPPLRPLPNPAHLTNLLRAQTQNIEPFTYTLPFNRIAKHPVTPRSSSKLLIAAGDTVHHKKFHHLPNYIPSDSLLILNSSRVIPARIPLKKVTGGKAELLLLHPVNSTTSCSLSQPVDAQLWRCVIGGHRIRSGDELLNDHLRVSIVNKNRQDATVRLHGSGTLADMLACVGHVPVPPYLGREAEEGDRKWYQTIYADVAGSVAAPTAGLHMTDDTLEELKQRNVQIERVLLHVGAGTFAPVKDSIGDHNMHEERVEIEAAVIRKLHSQINLQRPVVALGTTSVRTLESIYWYGVQLIATGETRFDVTQWAPYEILDTVASLPSATQALEAILDHLEDNNSLEGRTSLLIVPGYPFQLIDALITNFHAPHSTLLLLVSAFYGGSPSRLIQVYEQALEQGYRFLSYGDSSLYCPPSFLPKK